MSAEIITSLSFDTFSEQTARKRVVLLYPWVSYRGVFFAHVLRRTGNLFYFRIPEGQPSLKDWLSALAADFEVTADGFGTQVRRALSRQATAQHLAEALAADWNTYRDKPAVLFLDEVDRAPFDSPFCTFIQALVAALPADVQLVVSARSLTYQPWYDLVASGKAVVLGRERHRDNGIFSPDPGNRPRLEVYAFGPGHVFVNGQEIIGWDGALPRILFFYFMDHPLLTRDEIFATFWPHLSTKEATNVFHVTKRKISQLISHHIGTSESYELTRYSGGFYVPSEKLARYYDAANLQSAVERAATSSNLDEEAQLLRQAVALYRLPYLETVQMEWVAQRREHLRQLYAQALIGLGRIHKQRDEMRHALGFFLRALKETPEREDIHREVMSIYLNLGMAADARLHYQHLARMLKGTFGISPSKETQELYRMIESAAV